MLAGPSSSVLRDSAVVHALTGAAVRELRIPLKEDLAPGAYRVRQDILPRTSLPERSVHSPAFQVQPPGQAHTVGDCGTSTLLRFASNLNIADRQTIRIALAAR